MPTKEALPMNENLTKHDVTPELKNLVHELLAAMAAAQVMRDEVDEVAAQVLTEVILLDDEGKRITEPGRDWTCEDEAALHRFWAIVDGRLRAEGIKPAAMEDDHCPALVAEHERRKIEWDLLDEAAKMLDIYEEPGSFNNELLCCAKGLERRQEAIDINIGLVLAIEKEEA